MEKKMKVCIVGGGVAGVQCAHVLSREGHECHLFERTSTVGGVWAANYDGYGLQVPAELYQLVDASEDVDDDGTFPIGHDVLRYIQSFVRDRDLEARCKVHLNEEVVHVQWTNQWLYIHLPDDLQGVPKVPAIVWPELLRRNQKNEDGSANLSGCLFSSSR